jgi:SsrA-binding protein
MSKSTRKGSDPSVKVIARNRKARHEYAIDETLEAGLSLLGSEVKSLREANVEIGDAYGQVVSREAYLVDMQIAAYVFANRFGHEPKRRRKLLLHRREIDKLDEATSREGYTLIPLELYFKAGRVKVLLGLGRGKKLFDKRQDERSREAREEIARHRSER